MTSKVLSFVILGSTLVVLLTALSFIAVGQSQSGPLWLWTSWSVALAVCVMVVWQAKTSRKAWANLSLIGAIAALALLLAIVFVPVSASAPYEPGVDWQRTIDFTPPIVARLREALASAYFAIALVALAAVVLGFLSLVLHSPRSHRRLSH